MSKVLFCGFGRSGKDTSAMNTRFVYQVEIQTPGTTVRLIDCKGKILNEHTSS